MNIQCSVSTRLSAKIVILSLITFGWSGIAGAKPADSGSDRIAPPAIPELQTRRAKTVGEEFRNILVEGDLAKINAMLSMLASLSGTEPAAIPRALQEASIGRWALAADILRKPASLGDPNANALRAFALQAAGQTEAASLSVEAARSAAGPAGSSIASALAGVYYDQAGNVPLAKKAYADAGSSGPLLLTGAALQRVAFLIRNNDRRAALAAFNAQFGTSDADRVNQWRAAVTAGRAPVAPTTPATASATYIVDIVNLLSYGQQMGFGSESEASANAGFNGFASKTTLLWAALALNPDSLDTRLAIADQLDEVNESAAAVRVLLPVAPSSPSAAIAIARQDVRLGRSNAALSRLNSIPFARRDTSWHGVYAYTLANAGRFSEAETVFSAQIARFEGKANANAYALAGALLGRGAVRGALGRAEESAADIQRAAKIAEKEPILWGDVGSMLAQRKPTRNAGIALLRQAREKRPSDPFIRATLANALADDPETKGEAVTLLRGLLSEDEYSPERMNQLGYTLVDRQIDLDEGYRLLRDAYVRRPNSAQILDSFGKAHYQFGAFERARILMEKAVEVGAEAPEAEMNDNLGDTYWRLGRQDDARAQWQKVLDGDKSYRDRAAVLEKLKNGITTPAPRYRPLPLEADPDAKAA